MNQKGFTLIELLGAMAVGSLIMVVGLLSMSQVVWGTARTNDQTRALTQVNLAAMWLKMDLQMVQQTDLVDGDPIARTTLDMIWTDHTTSFDGQTQPVDHSIQYAINGTDLVRTFDGTDKVVARNITAIGFTRNGDYVNASVRAMGPGIIAETRWLDFSVYVKARTEI